MKTSKVLLLAASVLGCMAVGYRSVVRAGSSDPQVTLPLVIPFTMNGDMINLQGKINGADANLALDTGASFSALDGDWARAHGVTEASAMDIMAAGIGKARMVHSEAAASPAAGQAASPGGPVVKTMVVGAGGAPTAGQMGKVESLQLPGLAMRNMIAALIPLRSVWQSGGRPLHGVLGRQRSQQGNRQPVSYRRHGDGRYVEEVHDRLLRHTSHATGRLHAAQP